VISLASRWNGSGTAKIAIDNWSAPLDLKGKSPPNYRRRVETARRSVWTAATGSHPEDLDVQRIDLTRFRDEERTACPVDVHLDVERTVPSSISNQAFGASVELAGRRAMSGF
jgi:autotransporter translocation and assembly factor TamB